MDLALITPTSFLEKYARRGDIYLALAHLIDDEGQNEYASFHRREAEKGRRVILDNGLFEGSQVSTEALLRRAQAIRASVVCAPDSLYDTLGTIKAFKQFIRDKHEFGLVCDVMGIPQADNSADWWECFRFMELSKECSLIGLSILSIPQSFTDDSWTRPITDSRMYLIRQLANYESLVGRRATPCHMLGLGESLADLILATRLLPRTIISNDSSSAFVHGYNYVEYDGLGNLPGGKILEKLNFDLETELDDFQEAFISNNINKALQLAHMKWT